MARKKKKKRRLKKGAALVLKWSIAMIIIGTAAFFLMNMVYNRGIYVKTPAGTRYGRRCVGRGFY